VKEVSLDVDVYELNPFSAKSDSEVVFRYLIIGTTEVRKPFQPPSFLKGRFLRW